MPGASLLKVPLVVAVYDAAARGELDLAERVPLATLPSTRHPSVIAALAGEGELTLRALCGLAIVSSDNPCADYLLDRVGREAVNRCLHELGCTRSLLDVGVVFGKGVVLGVAVLTEGEGDLAAVSREIGDLVGRAWRAHGQRIAG